MSGVVTATILSNGVEMDPQYSWISIDIHKEVNRIPRARIILFDGDPARREFPLTDSDFFVPGSSIEIKLRYEGEDDITVSKGVVIRQRVRAGSGGTTLTVDLRDAAVSLTTIRKSQVFRDMTDSEIIESLIKDGGLKADSIDETTATHGEMVRYYCTNWDFILSRAEANGLWVLVDDGNISAQGPDLSGSVVHSFEFGLDTIYGFDMAADIRGQYNSLSGGAWDIENQSMGFKDAADFPLAQGNLDPGELSVIVGGESNEMTSPVSLSPEEVQAWGDAGLKKSRLSLLRGHVTVQGNGAINVGEIIELAGVSERFNGKTLVTGVRHQVGVDGWRSSVQFGLSGRWFSQEAEIVDTPAAGLLPAVNGLQIGVVEAFEDDPDKLHRVKVLIPGLGKDDGVIWARLASPEAGNARGYFFRPEAGDEVVLGFLNDDPRQAVILGGLYSEKNAPPMEPADENPEKGIVTKSELKVIFNDEEKSVRISTPSGNEIALEDDKGISLIDKNGNKLIMDAAGITIKSGKDIVIDGSNVTIKGSKVDVN